MKSASDVIHKTPWWALLAGGLALAIGLAVFVTPFHVLRLQKSGNTPAENQAIKREVDLTFSEGAIDIARGVIREMRRHANDPARQEELDQALEQIDEARQTLREAGAEVQRAKREAGQEVAAAAREASQAIARAQRDAARAMRDAGMEPKEIEKALEQARKAEEDAKRVETQAGKLEPNAAPAPPAVPAAGENPKLERRRLIIRSPHEEKPLVDIDLGPGHPGSMAPPPLSAAEKAQIREKVTGDLWRIGVGTGLILIFIPLFILMVVSKFFIDRSRAAQRMAELKRKEAEYHRMSQQVTEAKLSALQAQVEPHFLYNTLASVQALTEVDPQKANEMTGHLIQYLRNALPKMRESVSTVGQEVELVRAYLNILQMRMGKRLAFEIDVPPELMELAFPPLMLPSLVENAIKHGLEPQREGGEVRIHAEAVDDTLRMVVSDTGRGFAETVGGGGVGLTNIRERLAAMYGDRAQLTLEPREPHGVVATIAIPRSGARAAAAAPPMPEAPPAPKPETARTATARTLAAMGTAERAWRKGLSFTFIGLVVVAAIAAGLGVIGVVTGVVPVHIGDEPMGTASGALIGTAGIAVAFVVVVLALAIVLAVVYGLGFLLVGIAIFVPLVVLVSIFPVLAPFLLVGLGIWWLVRRHDRKVSAAAAAAAQPPAR
jgi:two-component sensor histidine kinase